MKYAIYRVVIYGIKCDELYIENFDINDAHDLADDWTVKDKKSGHVYEVREMTAVKVKDR